MAPNDPARPAAGGSDDDESSVVREPTPTGDDADAGRPRGEVYDWYRRGMGLLESGDAGAAAELFAHALSQSPESASITEAYARALFDSGRHEQAAAEFASLVEKHPDDDYAQFGLGHSLARLNRYEEAIEHLVLAAAMRPDKEHYVQALREARATLRARAERDNA
jgi:tetratricopeptide (TPR) repeat protein